MEEYELSPLDIKENDEIMADMKAADNTLKIALQFHSNLTNLLLKRNRLFWRRLEEKFGFKLETGYKITERHGCMVIVRVDENENNL